MITRIIVQLIASPGQASNDHEQKELTRKDTFLPVISCFLPCFLQVDSINSREILIDPQDAAPGVPELPGASQHSVFPRESITKPSQSDRCHLITVFGRIVSIIIGKKKQTCIVI